MKQLYFYKDSTISRENSAFNSPNTNKDDPNFFGKIRKLSVTCQLTDGTEYEGGELEFSFHHQHPDLPQKRVVCQEIKEPGSLIVFPSHLWHHVKPIVKGERYSLVLWSCGKSFK